MDDQVIKLILDMGQSGANVEAVQKAARGVEVERLHRSPTVMGLSNGRSARTSCRRRRPRRADRLVRLAVEQTQAQKAVARALDETATAVTHVGAAGMAAVGTKTAGGRGLLGVSYAVQDFTSVLSQGGGLDSLPRAFGRDQQQHRSARHSRGALGGECGQAQSGVHRVHGQPAHLDSALQAALGIHGRRREGSRAGREGPRRGGRAIEADPRELDKILQATAPEQDATKAETEAVLGGGRGPAITGGLAQTIGASGRGAQLTAEEQHNQSPEYVKKAVEKAEADAIAAGGNLSSMQRQLVTENAEKRRQANYQANQERLNTANVESAGKLVGAAPTDAVRGTRSGR